MSDLNAIQRIIEACEGRCEDGSVARLRPTEPPHPRTQGRTVTACETINHLMGATLNYEFVGVDGSDLVMPPLVLSRMLRAARGEHVELGRLVFTGAPSTALKEQAVAGCDANALRRRLVVAISEALGGRDAQRRCTSWTSVDAAQAMLAELLASWEAP